MSKVKWLVEKEEELIDKLKKELVQSALSKNRGNWNKFIQPKKILNLKKIGANKKDYSKIKNVIIVCILGLN